ncbi:BT_3044 domain-containing protein [Flectobacillus rivi]|uniref:DUF1735 domain-containing protein n=1 Tax=Flectobacillus rivi TaxID=2984209 RepID=A0ABT6Z126_9BACT|nr:DUF4361 domain-containing protein [Flectobacillus rivi]MDI9874784.1 DUF1735 domain-containing protein [Flectobacillus rivi]
MKKYINIINFLVLGSLLSMTSCIEEGKDLIEGKGSNFVRLPAANTRLNTVGLELSAGDKTAEMVEIIRDVNSNAELQSSVTVKVKIDNSPVEAYNVYAETNKLAKLQVLPTSYYKLSSTEVTFAPGEFSKMISITIDPTKVAGVDYAVGITVDNAGAYKIRSGLGSALFKIIAKNQWDGRYKAAGVFSHPTAGDRAIDRVKDLVSVNANTVIAELGDLGGSGYYMLLTINTDNSVTIKPSGATPNVDQSYSRNYYDPATKRFYLNYSYNVAAPRIVKETLTRQ